MNSKVCRFRDISPPGRFGQGSFTSQTSPYKSDPRYALCIFIVKMRKIWGWIQNGKKVIISIFLHKIMLWMCRKKSPRQCHSNTHQHYMIFLDFFGVKTQLLSAAPVAEWVRSLNFSALNHSIISPLWLV